jgi:hypothetical protein
VAPRPTLPDLVLLRLLPEKGSVAPAKLRADLGVFFRRMPTADEVAGAVAALRAEGLVAPKGQRTTDAGRARALRFLGVEELPPKANWRALKAQYLVPRALGMSTDHGITGDGERLTA